PQLRRRLAQAQSDPATSNQLALMLAATQRALAQTDRRTSATYGWLPDAYTATFTPMNARPPCSPIRLSMTLWHGPVQVSVLPTPCSHLSPGPTTPLRS